MRRGILGEPVVPPALQCCAVLDCIPGGQDLVGDLERGGGPAEFRPRSGDLLVTERRAVRAGRSLLVRRTVADHRLAADQRWP